MARLTQNPYVQQAEDLVNEAISNLQSNAKTASQTALDATEAVRKTTVDMLHAGVGAYLTLVEEASQTYSGFVARGEQVEWPQQLMERQRAFVQQQLSVFEKQTEEVVEAAKAQTAEVEAKAEEGVKLFEKTAKDMQVQVEKAVAEALHRIGMPTRQDVQNLQATVAKLNKQVDELRK
ncbi:MAG: phasin family protein [Bacteroidota bacterium]